MDFVSSGDSPGRRLLVHKIVEENFTRHVHKNPDTYSKVLFSGGDKGLFITSPHLYLVVLYGPCVIVYKEVHELFMHFRDIFFAQDTNTVFITCLIAAFSAFFRLHHNILSRIPFYIVHYKTETVFFQ